MSGLILAWLAALATMQVDTPADPRIQEYPYRADQVVPLQVSLGYAAVIELGQDEQVDSVIVGNSNGWQITETGRGDAIVVKPLAGASPTNMIVITSGRRYVFILSAPVDGASSFVVRFNYSGPARSAGRPASESATYRLSGAKSLFPIVMRDDGRSTYIRWKKETALPAVTAIKDGQESLVNGRMVGDHYVIEGVAMRYLFTYGDLTATAVRRSSKARR